MDEGVNLILEGVDETMEGFDQERTRLFVGRARLGPLRCGESGMYDNIASAVSTVYISRYSLVLLYYKRYLYIEEIFLDCFLVISSTVYGHLLKEMFPT